MYTINQKSISKVRMLYKMGPSESFAPIKASEDAESREDKNLIDTFRDLFKNPEFVIQIQAKIATLPSTEQRRLNDALNNVLNINNTIDKIHANVKGRLHELLNVVENQTA